jgi:endoglucanase
LCNYSPDMKKNKVFISFFKFFLHQLPLKAVNDSRKTFHSCLILTLLLISSFNISAQYLHTSGTSILDGNNEPIILRGMGLGGWMIQEGYMLETNSFANTQREIRAKIEDVIGSTNTQEFYDAWLLNHCTKHDIDSLASWGFNSVRLPMHYNLYTKPIQDEVGGANTWLDKGFAMTDSLLKWCAANQMYLILDLHAAPGGQGRDLAISDGDTSKPSLWESDLNKAKTVALWKKLAERYKDEPWIGGYDLINEINWNFTAGANANGCAEATNAPLRQLYVDIIAAIRQVDTHHMVIIEGNCWGNNHNGLHTPKLDNNLVISFHKYWNYNDASAIQGLLNLRTSVNAPLWLGESGENSNNWFTDAIRLVESNNIGWAWWPLKKVNSIVNPLTIVKNQGYADLLNYWSTGNSKPSVSTAKASLMQLAENLKIENCIYHKDVTDAMIRQVQSSTSIPFAENTVPGVIHASDFDLGRYNSAYKDVDSANYHVSTGTYTAWNNGWSYRNDGVDIQTNTDTDPNSNKLNLGWTADGEWLMYTLNVDSSAAYDVSIRYATSNSNTKVRFNINGVDQTGTITLTQTSGWGNLIVPEVVLYKGVQKFKFFFEKGGANFNYLNFTLSKKLSETTFKATAAATATQGSIIYVSVNKLANGSSISTTGLSATINGTAATITNAQLDANNANKIVITLDESIFDSDVIKVSYAGNTFKATDETLLENFTDLIATNNLPYHLPIPGKIEAESYSENHGLSFETCSDSGGGQDAGYTDAGDYLLYKISVSETGEYAVDGRIAANSQAGKIELQQLTEEGELLNSIVLDVPVTGGWQTWQTTSTKMTLTQGRGLLKVKINQAGFNFNWVKFTKTVVNGVKDERQGSLKVYPNPTEGHLTIEVPGLQYKRDNTVTIRSATGSLLKHNEQLSSQSLKKFYVGDLPAGLYILEFSMGNKRYKDKFVVQ